MGAKNWMQDRWEMLMPILAELTVDQEEEITRVCREEIAYWSSRDTMTSLSSLNTPMTFFRSKIRNTFKELTDRNSYTNPRSGKREHIALRYPNMNFSPEEWRAISAPSVATQQRRMEMQKTIADPEAVVAKGVELASSPYWPDRAVAVACLLGLRLSEVLGPETDLSPHTRYSVDFTGQLKRRDKILLPYERPTLGEAALVIDAWGFLRDQIEWKGLTSDEINDRYGEKVIDAANRHFERLVEPREDADLYTHLFRSVYSAIAVFYYCPDSIHELQYANTILGHYWIDEKGVTERDYSATLHYEDYRVSDEAVFKYQGKRKGVRLEDPGVEVLEVFKPKPQPSGRKSRKKGTMQMGKLQLEDTKDHTLIRVNVPTGARVGQVHKDLGSTTWDETVSVLLDEHYVLQQIHSLLSPLYEQLEVTRPLDAVQALLGDGGAYMVNEKLAEQYQTSLPELVGLLEDAKVDSGEKTSAEYLRELVSAKRTFRKSYEKRHKDKDYSTIPTSKLRGIKMPGAAEERFKRAVDTIIRHNETVTIPEFRRYVSPALIVDLAIEGERGRIGGRPSEAKEYIESRADVAAHHEKYGIKPGINRIALVSVKLEVPEWPAGVEPTESSAEVEPKEEETAEE